MEQPSELLRLRLADRPLSAHNLGGYAAGTKHVEQVALAQAVLFHQAAQPAVGRCCPACNPAVAGMASARFADGNARGTTDYGNNRGRKFPGGPGATSTHWPNDRE
jgi:hypothetical protein